MLKWQIQTFIKTQFVEENAYNLNTNYTAHVYCPRLFKFANIDSEVFLWWTPY